MLRGNLEFRVFVLPHQYWLGNTKRRDYNMGDPKNGVYRAQKTAKNMVVLRVFKGF